MNFVSAIARLKSEWTELPMLGCDGDLPSSIEIDDAERQLGCQFSEEYRTFLLECGAGVVGSLPVYGIRPTVMYPLDGTVLDATLQFRDQQWPLTECGPVISVDLGGNPIVEEQSGKVVSFDHDFGGKHEIGASFGSFVTKLMER